MSDARTSPREEPGPRPADALLSVENLTITYRDAGERRAAVRAVSFALHPREAYGLVGESGCGKSTIAFAIVRHLPAAGRVAAGQILFEGRDVLRLSERDLSHLRGDRIAMVYQDPGAALNPAMTVGDQIAEVYEVHKGWGRAQTRAAAIEILERVRMARPADVARLYPHQLSGGMQQRVIIAMALATNPALLIMDEPTTGLDATVEAAVLDLVAAIRSEFNAAILFISHNLAVVARLCDRIGVLYAGELVEEGKTAELFAAPHHPYTVGLLSCVPRFGARKGAEPLVPIPGHMPRPGEDPGGCLFAPRCRLARDICRAETPALMPTTDGRHARCFFWPEAARLRLANQGLAAPATSALGAIQDHSHATLLDVSHAGKLFGSTAHPVRAINDVSFAVPRGQVFGLVGESGSGKSTVARCIAGLLALTEGTLTLDGHNITTPVEKRDRPTIKRVQMVFQSPQATLNPRQTVRQILRRTVKALTARRGVILRERVEELARLVHLDPTLLDSYPGSLSGGQRQRVAIARAFAGDPDIVLCDEPVSNLDVSVQAAILNLLADLQERQSLSYVFISHDLAIVRYLADHVGVMYLGFLVEMGPVERVFAPPFHPYTEVLFASMPTLDSALSAIRAQGTVPSLAAIPTGCPFHTRCPRVLGAQCIEHIPPWQQTEQGHAYRCWIPPDQLVHMQRIEVRATAP